MGNRVTMKDIAEEASVSTGTVHRAIYGKKGVTEEVRQQILEICAKRGYRANTAASALKRGTTRIVAAFPGSTVQNRFFYANVWQGFRRCIGEMEGFNLEVVELPYYPETSSDQANELLTCYERYNGEIDALVTVGHFDAKCKSVVKKYVDHGIPVFLACDDTPDCGRIACVQANYDITGRITAELMASQLPENSAVLLCAGDVLIPSHYQTVIGFEEYMKENRPDLQILKVNGYYNSDELTSRLGHTLDTRTDIASAFGVSARLSVLLARLIVERGLEKKIRIVASDLFAETAANMEKGIVQNIIFKDPEQQAYMATRVMCDQLFKAQKPLSEVQYVESRIIFRSGLDMYRKYVV